MATFISYAFLYQNKKCMSVSTKMSFENTHNSNGKIYLPLGIHFLLPYLFNQEKKSFKGKYFNWTFTSSPNVITKYIKHSLEAKSQTEIRLQYITKSEVRLIRICLQYFHIFVASWLFEKSTFNGYLI